MRRYQRTSAYRDMRFGGSASALGVAAPGATGGLAGTGDAAGAFSTTVEARGAAFTSGLAADDASGRRVVGIRCSSVGGCFPAVRSRALRSCSRSSFSCANSSRRKISRCRSYCCWSSGNGRPSAIASSVLRSRSRSDSSRPSSSTAAADSEDPAAAGPSASFEVVKVGSAASKEGMMSCADSRFRVAFRKREPLPSWAEPALAYEPKAFAAISGSSDCNVASAGTICKRRDQLLDLGSNSRSEDAHPARRGRCCRRATVRPRGILRARRCRVRPQGSVAADDRRGRLLAHATPHRRRAPPRQSRPRPSSQSHPRPSRDQRVPPGRHHPLRSSRRGCRRRTWFLPASAYPRLAL